MQLNSMKEMLEDIREKQQRTDLQVGNLCENMSPSKRSYRDIKSANSARNIMIKIQNPNSHEAMTPLYCTK